MKRSVMSLAMALLFAVAVSQAATKRPAQDKPAASKSFTGEIMDNACAEMGSHKQMEEKEGLKSARACTLACMKNGSKLVLYDSSTKTIYQLSDQDKAKMYAGRKVTVKGTYDESSKTITVDSIQRGPRMHMRSASGSKSSR